MEVTSAGRAPEKLGPKWYMDFRGRRFWKATRGHLIDFLATVLILGTMTASLPFAMNLIYAPADSLIPITVYMAGWLCLSIIMGRQIERQSLSGAFFTNWAFMDWC